MGWLIATGLLVLWAALGVAWSRLVHRPTPAERRADDAAQWAALARWRANRPR